MINYFLMIFCSFLLIACHDDLKIGKSRLLFSSSSLEYSQGGLMMWGVSNDSKESFAIPFQDENETRSIDVTNGQWTFAGISWQGPSKLEGALKCGLTTIGVFGGEINVTLKMTEANCASPIFTGLLFKNEFSFAPLNVVTCDRDTALFDIRENNCELLPGKIRSFEVVMPEYAPYRMRDYNSGIKSECYNFDDGTFSKQTNILIPVAGKQFFTLPSIFATMIKLYSDFNCSDEFFYEVQDYPLGLNELVANPNFPNKGASLVRSVLDDTYNTYLFVKDAAIPLGAPDNIIIMPRTFILTSSCVGPFPIHVQDSNGQNVTLLSDLDITLSHSGTQNGKFFSDASCVNEINSIRMDAGDMVSNFYFKKNSDELFEIYATSSGLGSAILPIRATSGGIAVKMTLTGAPVGTAGSCMGTYQISTSDVTSASTAVTSNTTVNLTYTATVNDGAFYSDSGCTSPITSIVIPSGDTTSPLFYFKKSTAQTGVIMDVESNTLESISILSVNVN